MIRNTSSEETRFVASVFFVHHYHMIEILVSLAFIAQEICAPPADMCSQPSTNVSNSFVSYQFPLGLDFYDDADMSAVLPQSIFLEFVVSVEDEDRKLSSQTAMLMIPLKESGHVTWCEAGKSPAHWRIQH